MREALSDLIKYAPDSAMERNILKYLNSGMRYLW
jgi:hypothetical protein